MINKINTPLLLAKETFDTLGRTTAPLYVIECVCMASFCLLVLFPSPFTSVTEGYDTFDQTT